MLTYPRSKKAKELQEDSPSTVRSYDSNHLRLDDVIVAWYDDKERLNLQFTDNVVMHYSGTKTETVNGSSFEYVKGNKIEVSEKEHHVNPTGERLFKKLTKDIKPSNAGEVYDIMVRREEMYKTFNEYVQRRDFYIRAAYRNTLNKRPVKSSKKKGCGCGK